jgi:hypothetical protein
MDPVNVKREDLLILWTLREAQDEKGELMPDTLQLRGRVYYKDDPVMPKPRMLCEVLLPKDVAEGQTMEQLLAIAEERVDLDLQEIAHTGPFKNDAASVDPRGLDQLRECMAR